MPSLNIDLDFFTNVKVIRFAGILGPGSEIHLIRLWAFVGKHRPDTGGFDDWSADEVESAADWRGEKNKMIGVLLKLGLLHEWKNGYRIHDWADHAAHLIKYKKTSDERKKAAKKRWEAEKPYLKRGNAKSDRALEGDANSDAKRDFAVQENAFCNANAVQCSADTTSCFAEQNSAQQPPPLFPTEPPPSSRPSKPKATWNGSDFDIPDALYEIWEKAFPGVALENEVDKAAAWLISNPKRTKSNYTRFLTNWMARARPASVADDGYSLDPGMVEWCEGNIRKQREEKENTA